MNTLPSLDALTDRLAEIGVSFGVNVQPGQELVVFSPIEAAPLVRRIAYHAYRAGSPLVTTFFTDDASRLIRFQEASDASFDRAATWYYDGLDAAFKAGAARLSITGGDPDLLQGIAPARTSRANKSASEAGKAVMQRLMDFEVNWAVLPFPGPKWAQAVFPGEEEDKAVEKLWRAVAAATRIADADPRAAWERHLAILRQRTVRLNDRRYDSVRFVGPGTDLTVGLADDHIWQGGAYRAGNGVNCIPNMPTEEVFTMPHRLRVNGTVTGTKPLSHNGTLIEGLRMTFKDGQVVGSHAEKGEENLARLLESDPGACRLGEVALVPASSPIAASGLVFNNTLFDENAASHIAIGRAYPTCIDCAREDKEGAQARGVNQSKIHVDWMIGSDQIDVFGLRKNGSSDRLMSSGEWVAGM